eukprot:TRINITY_DN54875_c0_g1_i1.p1 TRINITY_DN54875_c0_g1~~TRINITY_DN54875_c0_g1_i1.p1  ORF type:complete len:520 (-),score=122.42 TRINITY_DN54875_c0_g1_i1:353-1912(-)
MSGVSYVFGALFVAQTAAVQFATPSMHEELKPSLARVHGDDDSKGLNEHGEYRQKMENYFDAQYTGIIKVGGQPVKAIIDTGSFELLVFGKNCTLCGSPENLYDETKSSKHKTSELDKMHSYGSGTTESLEAFDELKVGPLASKQQVFWEVYDANMPILQEDSFASIFGVGPPTSAAKFAEADAEQIHEQLDALKKSGTEITQEMLDIVESYDQAAKHAWKQESVVEALDIKAMSVCMGRDSGSDGFYIWNDTAFKRQPNKFLKLESTGSYYWSANMTNVKLSAEFGGSSGKGKAPALGCESQCSAVIDTGTSLIAAPSDIVTKLEDIIEEWAVNGGTCDDLSKLPNLEFNLNGNLFTLPPQAYVGRATGDFASSSLLRRTKKSGRDEGCTSMIMSLDADSPQGPMWILGMPFFREYYTTFVFRVGKKHGRHQPYSMAFSKATDTCEPGGVPAQEDSTVELMKKKGKASARGAQLNIDTSKLLVPTLPGSKQRVRRDLQGRSMRKLLPQKAGTHAPAKK